MPNDELKEFLTEMEDRIRYDIHEVANQLKDIQSQVNTLSQQVNNLEKIIRIVDQNNAGTLSGIRIDTRLIKDALEK
ncbi:hypothetical protein NZD89_02420 [Alicyclobacillus fastidiosus]|uniref:Uncharacterized protein n=1 Tax=Alicyclobacillus fastidiosus TaxID=392011 RepID=A0ABY6ZKG3_9BACL|nr:hypothetical protein [Alicyclobacillus fastidiosus]WAH42380.1 hypothetical protein NZD89_02420 [Alicyclobacillus fastidiosus]GMA64195.1 hypothetical protein GCM10025859_46350 [Alicyclobacillus fastidiosus]